MFIKIINIYWQGGVEMSNEVFINTKQIVSIRAGKIVSYCNSVPVHSETEIAMSNGALYKVKETPAYMVVWATDK